MLSHALGQGLARRYADVGLAAAVVAMVGMMILPLPTAVLDVLITTNLATAVVVLLVAIYVPHGLAFASLPTLLLITTLFRLALNVSSTRLILLQADAGQVIAAFGDFVVAGSYVVGAIIFAILTLIQFLVIAKGSERVAEVGARFTLDAMPGKQMSIDAELRGGTIDEREAGRRRARLERESQFYGSMDGAMKFVKGDAIAGIVITLFNLVGGLAVGMSLWEMNWGEALRTFGLLTIGDGLVSQIPALLISTAAGMVVTRVAAERKGGSLGVDIVRQLFGHRRALLVAAVFLAVLALVPGLPGWPFLVLAVLLAALGLRLRRSTADENDEDEIEVAQVPPLVVELPPNDLLAPRAIDQVLADVQRIFGVPVPRPAVSFDAGLEPASLRLVVDGVPRRVSHRGSAQSVADHLRTELECNLDLFLGVQEVSVMIDRARRTHPALVASVTPTPFSLPVVTEVFRRLVAERVSVSPVHVVLEALASPRCRGKSPAILVELVRVARASWFSHRYASSGHLAAIVLDPVVEDALRGSLHTSEAGPYLALAPDLAEPVITSARDLVETHAPSVVVLAAADLRPAVSQLFAAERLDVAVLSHRELEPEITVTPVGQLLS